MDLRNTTSYETAALRSMLRAVVREVEATFTRSHPKGYGPIWVQRRAEHILDACNVWIRQRRPLSQANQKRNADAAASWRRRAEASRAAGRIDDAVHSEDAAKRWDEYGGGGHGTGRASLGGGSLRLTLGGDGNAVRALWLMHHEVWHLFGVGHEDFPEAVMHLRGGAETATRERYAAVLARIGETLPAQVQPEAKPSAEERSADKLAAIADREKRWTTKLRRAQTALSKLKKSRRYYERQIAVAASRGGK